MVQVLLGMGPSPQPLHLACGPLSSTSASASPSLSVNQIRSVCGVAACMPAALPLLLLLLTLLLHSPLPDACPPKEEKVYRHARPAGPAITCTGGWCRGLCSAPLRGGSRYRFHMPKIVYEAYHKGALHSRQRVPARPFYVACIFGVRV